jgi:hypothetical protein
VIVADCEIQATGAWRLQKYVLPSFSRTGEVDLPPGVAAAMYVGAPRCFWCYGRLTIVPFGGVARY